MGDHRLELDPRLWAQHEFRHARLGHAARHKRLVQCAAILYADAASSIPRACESWAEAKGLYRFCDNPQVTHDQLLHGHIEATVDRVAGCAAILVAADTTHFSFGGRDDSDLGPVDTTGTSRGFMCHSALAFDAVTRRPLGLLAQKVWVRQKAPHRKTDSRRRRQRPRESQKWADVATQADQHLARLGVAKPCVIELFDAEGDHFETIEQLNSLGHDFVIRACRDRLLDTPDVVDEEDDPERKHLSEAAMTAPVLGRFSTTIPPRRMRPARDVQFEVRATKVLLRPPSSRNREGESIEVGLTYAYELKPPETGPRICLLLLTRQGVTTLEEGRVAVQQYLARWLIEEFHKAVKTGCSFEKRELQTSARLMNLLALTCPVAVQMLTLKHTVREEPKALASTVLNEDQLHALRTLRPKMRAQPSLYEALREIAGLGGFLGRKHDGEPGWQRLWLGFRDLLLAEQIHRAARCRYESG